MSKKDFKSSKAILDDLYQELKSQNGHSDDPDNDGGSTSDEEEDDGERRSRKRKDKKKHKKSKKKKKHKRSRSSDDNSDEYEEDRDRDRKKEKRSDSKSSSSRHENTKRVSRPLSPPVPTRRGSDYLPPQHDDYWHHGKTFELTFYFEKVYLVRLAKRQPTEKPV